MSEPNLPNSVSVQTSGKVQFAVNSKFLRFVLRIASAEPAKITDVRKRLRVKTRVRTVALTLP